MPKTKHGLTDKQERFCQEYVIDLNGTQAAIRAGYSKKTANVIAAENLAKPSISARVAEIKAEVAERLEITQDYILGSIKDTMERCKQAVPVLDRKGDPVMVENPDGDIVPAYMFQPMPILKGAELLGKHKGIFQPEAAIPDIHLHLHGKAEAF